MKVVNWKTTLSAVIPAIALLLNTFGVIDLSTEVQSAIVVVAVTLIGIFAKDSNVTGGTTEQ